MNYKTFSYKNYYQKDCPIVPLAYAQKFVDLAEKRGIPKEYSSFYNFAFQLNGNLDKIKHESCWNSRNKFCDIKIKEMRESGIPALETEGPYKGLPTINELKLLMFLSTTLSREELDEIIKNL